jgi:hypothetical protein
MLNSWVDVTEDRKETLVDLRPVRNSDSLQPSVRPNVSSEQLYKEYSWLFGGSRRR